MKETNRLKQKEQELRDLVETGKVPDSIVARAQHMAAQTEEAAIRVEKEGKQVAEVYI